MWPATTVVCRCSPVSAGAPVRATTSWSRWRRPASSARPPWSSAQMDEPRARAFASRFSALTMAEYFRDVQKQDVLLFIDNIFRFTQAGSEVSTLLGRMPSAVGYQPTLATRWVCSRSASPRRVATRSPRCRRSTCRRTTTPTRPGDDLRPPGRHHGALARDRLARYLPGRGPADLHVAHPRPPLHQRGALHTAVRVKQILQRNKELQDIIAILGIDELSEEDKILVNRARRISGSCRRTPTSPSSSPASRVRPCRWSTRSRISPRSRTASTTTSPSRRSSCVVVSTTSAPVGGDPEEPLIPGSGRGESRAPQHHSTTGPSTTTGPVASSGRPSGHTRFSLPSAVPGGAG